MHSLSPRKSRTQTSSILEQRWLGGWRQRTIFDRIRRSLPAGSDWRSGCAFPLTGALHQPALDQLGIPAVYERWHTTAADLLSRIEGCAARNSSAPASPCRTRSRSRASSTRCRRRRVEPVRSTPSSIATARLFGDNTDIYGFRVTVAEALAGERLGSPLSWALAVRHERSCSPWKPRGPAEIVVANRDVARATASRAELEPAPVRPIRLDEELLARELPRADVLVNATSLGWHPGETPTRCTRLDLLPADALVADLTYRDTDLLLAAQSRGLKDGRRTADAGSPGGPRVRALDRVCRAGRNDAGSRPRGASANLIGDQEGAGGVNVAARTDRISVTFARSLRLTHIDHPGRLIQVQGDRGACRDAALRRCKRHSSRDSSRRDRR